MPKDTTLGREILDNTPAIPVTIDGDMVTITMPKAVAVLVSAHIESGLSEDEWVTLIDTIAVGNRPEAETTAGAFRVMQALITD